MSGPTEMKVKDLLDRIVHEIRSIPARLSGDDSPLGDPWEEIKEQVQHGASSYWSAYVTTISSTIAAAVDALSPSDLALIAHELRLRGPDRSRICEAMLKRLLTAASREKIRYEPFDFEYCRYSIYGMSVYARLVERTGLTTCRVVAYSCAAPSGEEGDLETDMIENIMSAQEFEHARHLQWPERYE
jgi:hypothetical protein